MHHFSSNVRFAENTATSLSRPPTNHEETVLLDFNRHIYWCRSCGTELFYRELCRIGRRLAEWLSYYLYERRGSYFSTRSTPQFQIRVEIPTWLLFSRQYLRILASEQRQPGQKCHDGSSRVYDYILDVRGAEIRIQSTRRLVRAVIQVQD